MCRNSIFRHISFLSQKFRIDIGHKLPFTKKSNHIYKCRNPVESYKDGESTSLCCSKKDYSY